MNEILSSQVHEHIFGGDDDDENNNLNGPRRLLAENLDYQQMELTTEDREDHTFNGEREVVCLFFTSFCRETHTLDCLLYTSPSPRDGLLSRMPSSA